MRLLLSGLRFDLSLLSVFVFFMCLLLSLFCLRAVWWARSHGELRIASNEPWLESKFPADARRVWFLFLIQSTLPFSSGVILPDSRVIWEWGGHWLPFASGLGGLPWLRTSVGSWVLARSVLRISLPIYHPLVCYIPFSFLPVPGFCYWSPSSGNTVILTVVDRFSKAVHFVALPKLPSARETAWVVIDHVFRIHGLPEDVVSDRKPQFVSHFWRETIHPQTNGQSERVNQDLGQMLRCLASHNPSTWNQQLNWTEYTHNSLPVFSTGLSPFMCCLGYQPPLFPSQGPELAVPSIQAFIQRCRRPWRRARDALTRSGGRTKIAADRHWRMAPKYVCGQRVWLSTKDLPLWVPGS